MSTETKETIDVRQFCEREGITLRPEKWFENPNMENGGNDMDHWKCHLSRQYGRLKMMVHYSMGRGHNGKKPEVGEVIDCLLSDYVDDSQTFEDWCSEFGYDDDSRKAERTFNACKESTEKLKQFMGPELMAELLNGEVERL